MPSMKFQAFVIQTTHSTDSSAERPPNPSSKPTTVIEVTAPTALTA